MHLSYGSTSVAYAMPNLSQPRCDTASSELSCSISRCRITTLPSKGIDIAIESIGGAVTSEALSSLGLGGVLITLGYSAGRKTTIDVTDLIWKRARMAGFSLFAQSPTAIAAAWRDVMPLMVSGSVKPIVERVYRFGETGEALRHLIEDRPSGKVVLAG